MKRTQLKLQKAEEKPRNRNCDCKIPELLEPYLRTDGGKSAFCKKCKRERKLS